MLEEFYDIVRIISFCYKIFYFCSGKKKELKTLSNFVSVLLLVETGWLCAGITWLAHFYQSCTSIGQVKDVMLGKLFAKGVRHF